MSESNEAPNDNTQFLKTYRKDCAFFCRKENDPVVATPGNDYVALRLLVPLGEDHEARGFGVVYEDDGTGKMCLAKHRRIAFRFPRDVCYWEFESADSNLLARVPEAKNTDRGYTLVILHLREGAKPVTEGFGMPFANASDPELEAWVNSNGPISGVSFLEVLQQETFHLLVANEVEHMREAFYQMHLGSPFDYPFGEDHLWDVGRFEQLWVQNPRQTPYNPTYR